MNFVGFIIVLICLGVLVAHLFRALNALANWSSLEGNNNRREEALLGHLAFSILCLPFIFDMLIADVFWYEIDNGESFVTMMAVAGFLSLFPFLFEWILHKCELQKTADLMGQIFLGILGIFLLWRLYEIIAVREHWWLLILPFFLIGSVIVGVVWAIITGENQPQASPPQQQWQPPMASTPPKPKLVIDHDDDHPIKPDPASVFEKRGR